MLVLTIRGSDGNVMQMAEHSQRVSTFDIGDVQLFRRASKADEKLGMFCFIVKKRQVGEREDADQRVSHRPVSW